MKGGPFASCDYVEVVETVPDGAPWHHRGLQLLRRVTGPAAGISHCVGMPRVCVCAYTTLGGHMMRLEDTEETNLLTFGLESLEFGLPLRWTGSD